MRSMTRSTNPSKTDLVMYHVVQLHIFEISDVTVTAEMTHQGLNSSEIWPMYLEIQDNFFNALEAQSSEIWLACRSSEKVEKWDPMVLILHLRFPF